MNCYIKIDSTNKAKQDIDTLMAGMGFRNIAVRGVGGRKAETFMRKVFSLVHSLFVLKRGDVLVMQYPYKKFYALQCRAARFKGARTITLIHDLGTFRRRKLTAPQEMRRLSHTDYIIAHNDRMKQWLVEHGRDGSTVGTLGIFDYLPKGHARPRRRVYDLRHAPVPVDRFLAHLAPLGGNCTAADGIGDSFRDLCAARVESDQPHTVRVELVAEVRLPDDLRPLCTEDVLHGAVGEMPTTGRGK